MNAHTLRKWSPIKLLMYLWLPIYILLIIWCQGAFTMHLTSHNNHKSSLFQTSQEPSYYSSLSSSSSAQSSKLPSSVKTTRAIDQTTPSSPSTLSYSSFAKSHYSDSFERQIKDDTTNWVTKDTSISLLNTTTKTIGTTTITRTTGPYNQIPEQRTYFDTNSNRSNERERGGKIILSYSFDNNNNNNNSSSNRTRSKNSGNHLDDSNILDYEESHLQKIWQSRLREKRARIMAHRRQRQIFKHLTNHKYIDNVKHETADEVDNDNDDDDDEEEEQEQEQEEVAVEEVEDVVEGITIDNGKHRSDSLIGNNNYNLNNNNQNNGNNNKNKDLNNININNNNNNLTTFNIKNNDNVKNDIHHHHHNSGALSVASRNRRESRNHFTVQQHMPHQQQQQPTNHRQRQRRYCSARDPRTLSFEAPTVFEGKIKSMSSDRRTNFSVTFEIIKIYKKPQSQKLPQNVRLQFSYRNYSECDIYREEFRQRGFVRDELEQGKLYFLFVKQMSLGNFSILGQPIKKAKRVVNDVLLGVSENYGKRASIESLTYNVTVKEGKRVRLVCKVNGQPAPKVTWFKDGRSINRNRLKYSFVHLRRRSELIIKSAVRNDTGRYECRAKNKLAPKPVLNFTRIEVLPKDYTPTKQPNGWKSTGSNCPSEGGDLFCLNGGTCVFFKDVGEPACNCPDGFIGNRCETKNPTNIQPSTYSKQQECGDKFIGGYYC